MNPLEQLLKLRASLSGTSLSSTLTGPAPWWPPRTRRPPEVVNGRSMDNLVIMVNNNLSTFWDKMLILPFVCLPDHLPVVHYWRILLLPLDARRSPQHQGIPHSHLIQRTKTIQDFWHDLTAEGPKSWSTNFIYQLINFTSVWIIRHIKPFKGPFTNDVSRGEEGVTQILTQ